MGVNNEQICDKVALPEEDYVLRDLIRSIHNAIPLPSFLQSRWAVQVWIGQQHDYDETYI